jgi:hypothetical protein
MVDGVALLTAKLQGLGAAGLFSDQPTSTASSSRASAWTSRARSPAAPETGPEDVHQLIDTWCPAPLPGRT